MIKSETIVQIHKVKKPGQKKKMINALSALVFFIILTCSAFVFLYPKNQKFILEEYQINTVSIDDLENSISLTGLIDLDKQEAVLAPYNSVCTSISKESGELVKKGETILILDSITLLQERDTSVTVLKKIEREVIKNTIYYQRAKRVIELSIKKSERATLKGEKKLKKIESLYDLESATLQELESIRDEQLELIDNHNDILLSLDNLEEDYISDNILFDYDLKSIHDQLNRQNDLIDRLTIKAPFSGTILSIETKTGELVSGNQSIVNIGDMNTPYVILNVPEKNRQFLSLNQPLEIKIDKKIYLAKLNQINAIATRGAKGGTTIQVEAVFNEIPENIVPGARCGAEIIVSTTPDSLILPRGAFISTGKDRYLYRVSNNGKQAERIKIVFGSMNSTNVAISNGVDIGDEIITSGYSDFINKEIIYLKSN